MIPKRFGRQGGWKTKEWAGEGRATPVPIHFSGSRVAYAIRLFRQVFKETVREIITYRER
jgi:hypothetical protein